MLKGLVLDTLPFPRPKLSDPWVQRVAPLVLRLTCTAPEMTDFWNAMALHGLCKPVPRGDVAPTALLDEELRALARAEVDAVVAYDVFSLSKEEVSDVLETFPVLKKRDEKAYGEYRTRRLILELYDAMAEAARTGMSYRTPLEPLPAAPSASHGVFAAEGTPTNYAEALRMGLLFSLIRRSGEAGVSQGTLSRALLWLEDARHAATWLQGAALADFERVRESDPLLAQGSSDAPKLLQALENERSITRDPRGIVRLRAGSTIPNWLPQTPTLTRLASVMQSGLEQAEAGASTTLAVEKLPIEKAKGA